eukprot:214761_1
MSSFNKHNMMLFGCGVFVMYSYYRWYLNPQSTEGRQLKDNESPSQHPVSKLWSSPTIVLGKERLDTIEAHYKYSRKHLKMNGTLMLDHELISRHNEYTFTQLIEKHLRNGLYSTYTIYADATLDCFANAKQCGVLLQFVVRRDFNLVKQYLEKNSNVIHVCKGVKIVFKVNDK